MSYEKELLQLFNNPVCVLDDVSSVKVDTSSLDRFIELDTDKFYPSQIMATKTLISKFSKTRMILLLSQMQSGKTGTYLFTACSMVHFGLVERVIIFTGVPDIDLYTQLNNSVSQSIIHFNRIMGVDLTDKIIAVKASQLSKLTIPPNTLVVWDVSHYDAQDRDNTPFQMFKSNHLLVDGTKETYDLWRNKGCYLLSVSATPFSEFVDNKDISVYNEITKEIVTMYPGHSYRGVIYYHENNHILPSWDIMNVPRRGQHKFVEMLRERVIEGKPQYGILRSCSPPENIKLLAEHAGWNVEFYDMKNRESMVSGCATLDTAPNENTIIVLKNMGRLGQVIPKQHVSFVFESTTSTNSNSSDTVLQSLLGRMCGYGPFNPTGTKIYVPKCLIDEKDVDGYDLDGSENSLKAIITLKKDELEIERNLYHASYRDDEFAIDNYNMTYDERVTDTIKRVIRDHTERLEYATSSEIQKYVNLMSMNSNDVPRYVKNIVSSQKNQKTVGIVGYSTIPEQIKVDMTDYVDTEWTPIYECASIMNCKNGSRRLTKSHKLHIVDFLIKYLETRDGAFSDIVQRIEIITLLKSVRDGKFDVSKILNFGDLNSNTRSRQRVIMEESIKNNMPYNDLIKHKHWRENDCNGGAKRLQLLICSPIVGRMTQGVNDFNNTSTLYFTGFTYGSTEDTKDKHRRQQIPSTIHNEAFYHGHVVEDCDDKRDSISWINVIKDEHAFMALIETIFPAGVKIRLILTNTVPKSVVHHIDKLLITNNGRFKVVRIRGRQTLEDKAVGAQQRYNILFFERSSMSIV